MPSYPFTVTVQANPAIEVFGTNISYEELLNSFGAYWYLLEEIFLETYTNSQANQPISFRKFDVNGNKRTDVVVPAIDPYGKQSALMIELQERNLVADGQLIMSTDILPLSQIRYTFYTMRGYVSEAMNENTFSNKQKVTNV